MSPAPLPAIATRIERALVDAARTALGVEVTDLFLQVPPKPAMGDFAVAAFLPLAKSLKRPPREIAQAVLANVGKIDGVSKLEIAGPGYVNVFLDRPAMLRALLAHLESATPPQHDAHDPPTRDASKPKIIVEHTNINPNKAAHVGHLRNAVLGDCLVRLLQSDGTPVEVQNYIDDTGVQVGDVVVAFTAMEGRTPEDALAHVAALIDDTTTPFDHACWDLYSAVGRWYAEDAERLRFRREALHAMEHGEGALARLGRLVAMNIVHHHLALMSRIGVRYHLLPKESDVLAARFWADAFERMKERGAVHLQNEGKNSGCWVMPLTETEEFKNLEDPDKVIVRGDGTVTYVGKDIAYQLWKLGLIGRDFAYSRFHDYGDGRVAWQSDVAGGSTTDHPAFGNGSAVYNVIDVRQSYLQAIVKNALLLLGHHEQAERSVHYAYEMVALTPRTAQALGFELTDEEKTAPFVEMSGRRGLGVKADELLARLKDEALRRVSEANAEREMALTSEDLERTAEHVAVGALRFYMVKVTRTRVIAFDIEDALQVQGETGPYLQYAAVRAANIFRKLAAEGMEAKDLLARCEGDDFAMLADDATWELVLSAARVPEVLARTRASLEIATLAKHAFVSCQQWNSFYRENKILHAETRELRRQRAAIARAFLLAHRQVLGTLGIPEPERM